ncbi:MAG: hypothetical protein COB03_07215, partial [Alteromonas sp.]
MQQFIPKDQLVRARAPMLGSDYTGLHWVGPAIIQFGTPEQKARYIPEILDELRAGRVIILVDDENRENEGDFV